MRWGEPSLWWLSLGPVLVVLLLVYGHIVRRQLLAKVGHIRQIRSLIETLSLERRLTKQLMLFLAFTLLTVAALRPQYGRRPETLRQSGIDIAIAFDISKSMLARDTQPSRLQAARTQLADLMDRLSGDRIALVPFAGIAFTQSPLTADQGAIRMYMDSLDPKQMPVGGTNLAMAMEEGVRLLTGKQDRGDQGARSRVLLLITDGEDVATDQGEAAKEAARKAAEAGIKLYAVAVGTRLGEPIPIFKEDGSHGGYQKDNAGKPIYSRLNMELLEELARLADPESAEATRVFHFEGTNSIAGSLAAELDTLQKTALANAMRHTYNEKFQYVLVPAILLLLIELFIGERRRRRDDE